MERSGILNPTVSSLPAVSGASTVTPSHFLADLYTFNWTQLNLELPLVSAAAVALCVFTGIALGHPGGALVAAGGALTIGFGANQRIADSRLWPMIAAIFAMSSATLAGTLAGHRSYGILIASACASALYAVLTIRHSGLAWVGQQAAVSLFVASAFPQGPKLSFQRAGLIAIGGLVQLVFTSAGLHLLPELRKDLLAIPRSLYRTFYEQRRELLRRLRELNHHIPQALPAPNRRAAALYSARLIVTVLLATELYRRLHMQSGYWIPMTALLVQKPAFFDTAVRGSLRVLGTLAGAYVATLIAGHTHPGLWTLGALVVFFAFWCFATNAVNYGLFTLCITSYIVFLLSLNLMPGPEIAHRRAGCTVAGAVIALALHLDALRRHRKAQTAP